MRKARLQSAGRRRLRDCAIFLAARCRDPSSLLNFGFTVSGRKHAAAAARSPCTITAPSWTWPRHAESCWLLKRPACHPDCSEEPALGGTHVRKLRVVILGIAILLLPPWSVWKTTKSICVKLTFLWPTAAAMTTSPPKLMASRFAAPVQRLKVSWHEARWHELHRVKHCDSELR